VQEAAKDLSQKSLENKLNLKRNARLAGRESFARFFKNPKKASRSFCLIYQVPNSEGKPRVGITLKIKTSSVVRNRIRRVIRETFRVLKKELGSFDYNIVIGQQKSFEHPYSKDLQKQLKECFLQLVK